MDQPTYDRLFADNRASHMIRATWSEPDDAYPEDLTVVICTGKARSDPPQYSPRMTIQLCLESLLRFYPDIRVLVVNGAPTDQDSSLYLDYMSLKYKHVKVWHRGGENSHGDMMNDAIRYHVRTNLVMLLDNDSMIHRPGLVEGMLEQMQPGVFATGATMIVSRKNEACGVPFDDTDVLRYAHPSCAIVNRSMYIQVRPFCNHGAPCWASMADAEKNGWIVESFNVKDYSCHLSGHSWCNPRTIWNNDHDVVLKPFVSFILESAISLDDQTDHDFECLPLGKPLHENVIIHDGFPAKEVNNRLYDLRFRVHGEYVCKVSKTLPGNFVHVLRKQAVDTKLPEVITIEGITAARRMKWQNDNCLK
jgi:glycosyltransferase involved in cell wall biosynthesis